MEEVDATTATIMGSKGFQFAPLEIGGQMMVYMNTIGPNSLWSNPKVRKALEYSITKGEIAHYCPVRIFYSRYQPFVFTMFHNFINRTQLEIAEKIGKGYPNGINWDIDKLRPELKGNESERNDPFHAGGNPVPRPEYLYLDK